MSALNPFLYSGLDEAKLSAVDFRLLAHIHRVCGRDGNCFENHSTISRATGIGLRVIPAAIERLKNAYSFKGEQRDLISETSDGLRPKHPDWLVVPREIDMSKLSRNAFRVFFHIRRSESPTSPCVNSLRKMKEITRIHHQYVNEATKELSTAGLITKEGNGWSTRYRVPAPSPSDPNELNPLAIPLPTVGQAPPPPAGSVVVQMTIPASFTAPLTLDEMDEAEGTLGVAHPQLMDPAVVRCAMIRTQYERNNHSEGPSLETRTLALVHSLPADGLNPVHTPEELSRWMVKVVRYEHTVFSGLPTEYARAATLLYAWKGLSHAFPEWFTPLLGDIDVERCAHAIFNSMDIIFMWWKIRERAALMKPRQARVITSTYRFCGTALCALEANAKRIRRAFPDIPADVWQLNYEEPVRTVRDVDYAL